MTPRELAEKITEGYPNCGTQAQFVHRIESLLTAALTDVRMEERKELLGTMILHSREERIAGYEKGMKIAKQEAYADAAKIAEEAKCIDASRCHPCAWCGEIPQDWIAKKIRRRGEESCK